MNDKSENTVVSFEYPEAFERGRNDRYYPIVRDENQNLYNRYLEKAKELKNVYFLGRLGDYKYYDMDKAVNRALALFDEVFAKKGEKIMQPDISVVVPIYGVEKVSEAVRGQHSESDFQKHGSHFGRRRFPGPLSADG